MAAFGPTEEQLAAVQKDLGHGNFHMHAVHQIPELLCCMPALILPEDAATIVSYKSNVVMKLDVGVFHVSLCI